MAAALARRHTKEAKSKRPGFVPATPPPPDPSSFEARVNAEAGPSQITAAERGRMGDHAEEPLDLLLAVGRNTRMGEYYLDCTAPPDFLKLAFPLEDDLRCVSQFTILII